MNMIGSQDRRTANACSDAAAPRLVVSNEGETAGEHMGLVEHIIYVCMCLSLSLSVSHITLSLPFLSDCLTVCLFLSVYVYNKQVCLWCVVVCMVV